MSQPNPKITELDFASAIGDRRTPPLPITHLPVNALTDDTDPTREIRSLIEQLQQQTRDTRTALRTAESERDALAAQAQALQHQNEELRSHYVEITTIIRERDLALQHVEQKHAEAERNARAAQEIQAKLTAATRDRLEAIRQRDEAMSHRDDLGRLREELTRQRDDMARARDEANARLEALTRTTQETNRQIADAQRQILSIRQARDSAQAQKLEITQQLAQAQEELVSLRDQLEYAESQSAQAAQAPAAPAVSPALEEENERLRREAAAAEMRLELLTRESEAAREEAEARAAEVGRLQAEADYTATRTKEQETEAEMITMDLAASIRAREEVQAQLQAAQQQNERLLRERDLAREGASEHLVGLEAQVEALRAQLAIYESTDPDGAAREVRELIDRLDNSEAARRETAQRLEEQRTATIDLAARLQTSQEQIRELSVSLAEARLLTKGTPKSKTPPSLPFPMAEPAAPVPASSFDLVAGRELLAAMRQCYQAFIKTPSDLSFLNELHAHVHAFSERARTGGMIALHRLANALAGLAQELYHYPEQVNASSLRTVHSTIEFLSVLIKMKDIGQAKDPASAQIYAVDDDPDNCECIRMAMETSMMRTRYATEPAAALCELANTDCDLIFLDVNLPGMDGFELCSEVRNLSRHRVTPVIFLTGLPSAENRQQSAMSGGNDFVGKPFILCELTVKALTLIMKSQLHLA